MFGKKEKMVKITEEKYQWLVEKVKERQEYKKRAEVAEWHRDIAMRGLRMTQKDWELYYSFIYHDWYRLSEEAKENELRVAREMAQIERDEEEWLAFSTFIQSTHDREFYSKKEADE